MKDTIEEKSKKTKHIKVSYGIDSFQSLIDYHESKAISNAFFIAFACVLTMSLMEYDTIVAAAFILVMAFMYRFYFWQTKRKLIKPKWEESEIDEEE